MLMSVDRIFQKNGFYIKVERDPSESNEQFIERGYYALDLCVKGATYDNAITLSYVKRNKLSNGAVYNKKVEELV